jgi:hypothetical protein
LAIFKNCTSHNRQPNCQGSDLSVAQIFNLLYRGFLICGALEDCQAFLKAMHPAECNSAMQQIENLRYIPEILDRHLPSARKTIPRVHRSADFQSTRD